MSYATLSMLYYDLLVANDAASPSPLFNMFAMHHATDKMDKNISQIIPTSSSSSSSSSSTSQLVSANYKQALAQSLSSSSLSSSTPAASASASSDGIRANENEKRNNGKKNHNQRNQQQHSNNTNNNNNQQHQQRNGQHQQQRQRQQRNQPPITEKDLEKAIQATVIPGEGRRDKLGKKQFSLFFECPYCGGAVQVESRGINCGIFRHGVLKGKGKGINPHAKKEDCDRLANEGAIYGCGKPFRIHQEKLNVEPCDDKFFIVPCDYL